MMKAEHRWKIVGLFYFTIVFGLIPTVAFAYIDPSVTTYAIQAVAGVVVAAGAFFATYGRRMKKKWMKLLDVGENENRQQEAMLEVTREDLKQELAKQRASWKISDSGSAEKKNIKGRVFTSLLCGLAIGLTAVLRPIISFYLSNESEFWFYLEEVVLNILLLSGGVALVAFLVHFGLPGKGKINLRLIFAAVVAAICLGMFVQNHFMSSYLPVLTGEQVDWSQYAGWGAASLVLWIGLFVLFIGGALIKPGWFKSIVYGAFILLICTETVTGGIDLLTTERESHEGTGLYFSRAGIFESSTKGNVVVLVSDTFEGTYMYEVLEAYPEVRKLLPEVTFYDNVTGIGSMTYLSYTNLLTGLDFPMGKNEKGGIQASFESETLISAISNNGWDIAYYSDFKPTENLIDKVMNCETGRVAPNREARWCIVKYLWKNALYQSMPQQLKDLFVVYTQQYDLIRSSMPETEQVKPYTEDDQWFYWTMVDQQAVTAVDAEKPRYILVQMWGLHDPCSLESNFHEVDFDSSVSYHDRKLKAGRAMMLLLREYLDQLKAEGTYENTTVIMIADHGFNMRYYPVLLVKEAGSEQTEFRIDNTPLSLKDDFAPLMTALTAGKSFTLAIEDLGITSDRIRTATDYRCTKGYGEVADKRTDITIIGEAKDTASYSYGNDEFTLDDTFGGRCELNTAFMQNGKPNDTVAVYGISDGRVYGHTFVFDVFFDTEETRTLTLFLQLENVTHSEQCLRIRIDGEVIGEYVIPAMQDNDTYSEGLRIILPEKTDDRWTVYIDTPDAIQRVETEKVLPWVAFNSVKILTAVFGAN